MNGWTEGWQQLDDAERCYWRRVGAGVAVLMFVLGLVLALQGCAAPTFDGVCAVKAIGQNDSGVAVVFAHCEPAR